MNQVTNHQSPVTASNGYPHPTWRTHLDALLISVPVDLKRQILEAVDGVVAAELAKANLANHQSPTTALKRR